MAVHRYWRLNIRSTWSADVWCAVSTLIGWSAAFDGDQMLSSLGVVCTASSTFGGFPAANANDNNNGTSWITGTFANPTTLTFDLGVGVFKDIRQISFANRADGFFLQFPKDYDWQWSDDNIAWTTSFSATTPAPTAVSQFYTSPSAGAATSERLSAADVLIASHVATLATRLTLGEVYTAINFPTPSTRASAMEGLVTVKHSPPLRTTEAAVLVAIRGAAEVHLLRAWTFTQDDHDFYVLGLGTLYPTFVLDLMTNQWSEWNTEGRTNWRTSDGIAWDNDNVAGDLDLGVIWNIDADQRLEGFSEDVADTRTIVTVVRGLMAIRLRNSLSCARAVLEISEYDPAAAGGYVTLKTSDDFGNSWHDHGTLVADDAAVTYDIAWASLGLITAPGRIFEITEAGVSRRIDGLDVDLGADEGKVQTGG